MMKLPTMTAKIVTQNAIASAKAAAVSRRFSSSVSGTPALQYASHLGTPLGGLWLALLNLHDLGLGVLLRGQLALPADRALFAVTHRAPPAG